MGIMACSCCSRQATKGQMVHHDSNAKILTASHWTLLAATYQRNYQFCFISVFLMYLRGVIVYGPRALRKVRPVERLVLLSWSSRWFLKGGRNSLCRREPRCKLMACRVQLQGKLGSGPTFQVFHKSLGSMLGTPYHLNPFDGEFRETWQSTSNCWRSSCSCGHT